MLHRFFEAFDIPPTCCKKYYINCANYGGCEQCVNFDESFSSLPEISDLMYLHLICILTTHKNLYVNQMLFVNSFKIDILNECIDNKDLIYEDVKKLFGLDKVDLKHAKESHEN